MAEKLLINVAHEETRVALVESGKIQNLEIDTSRVDNNKGNIYKGVVHRVNQSLQAAFVDYGAEKQGFLPVSEIHTRYYPKELKGKKAPIQDILVQGQELMVQIVKDEIGNKGASLTTFISLPGRYIVLMADSDKTGISRRVDSDERSRLKKALDGLPVPDGFGLIVRTAGVDREQPELAQDLEYLTRLWNNLQEAFRTQRGSGIIHQERHIALRFIRDYVNKDVDEILVDNKDVHQEIANFCTALAPELKNKVRLYSDSRPLFSRYQIEDQIDDIFARRIDLPSGGSIVIDQTEALVAIDVNSGRVKTDDIEQTALTTNLEAAAEIARQLRIRDRGGLIVVDFIDMRSKDNIRSVEQTVRDAFASDKAKVKFSRISEFGLMEISRQRMQSSLMTGSFTPCRACAGSGRVRSVESSALYLLRRLKETVLRGNYMHAQARMSLEIANYLLNRKRRELTELESESETGIEVHADEHCAPMVAYVELLSRPGKSKRPRRILQTIDLVRSEIDKRDLDDDEDYLSELTESRTGWTGPGSDRSALDLKNGEVEAAMALEKERIQAQREADESLRRQQEFEERTRAAEAEAALLREKQRIAREQLSLWGRIKVLFTGMPTLESDDDDDDGDAKARKPERRPERAAAAKREEAPSAASSSSSSDGRRGRGGRDDDDRGRGRKPRASGERSSRSDRDGDRSRGRRDERGAKDSERGSRDERGGRAKDDRRGGERSDRRGRGRRDEASSSDDAAAAEEATEEVTTAAATTTAEGAQGESSGGSEDDGGRKKRRRRRRRKSRGDGDASDASGSDDSDDNDDDSDDDSDDSDDTSSASGDRGRGRRSGREPGEGRGRREPRESRGGRREPRRGREDGDGDGGRDKREAGEERAARSESGNADGDKAAASAPAVAAPKTVVPKAGGVIDLRGGVVDLRGGRGSAGGRTERSAPRSAPAESRAADAPKDDAGAKAESDARSKNDAKAKEDAGAKAGGDARSKTDDGKADDGKAGSDGAAPPSRGRGRAAGKDAGKGGDESPEKADGGAADKAPAAAAKDATPTGRGASVKERLAKLKSASSSDAAAPATPAPPAAPEPPVAAAGGKD